MTTMTQSSKQQHEDSNTESLSSSSYILTSTPAETESETGLTHPWCVLTSPPPLSVCSVASTDSLVSVVPQLTPVAGKSLGSDAFSTPTSHWPCRPCRRLVRPNLTLGRAEAGA